LVKNIIFGSTFVDFGCVVISKNHKTGEVVEVTLSEARGNEPSYLKGKGFDKNGKVTYEIEGSWLSEVRMKNVETGQSRVVWKDEPPGPDAHLQYFF
jgi:hypothetical protein